MNVKLVLVGAAAVVTLVLGSLGVVADQLADDASQPAEGQHVAQAYGVIDAIAEQSITLVTPCGEVALLVDVNTIFRMSDVETPGLDDFSVGDTVVARGWWEGDTFHTFGLAQVDEDHLLPLAGTLNDVTDDYVSIDTPHCGVVVVYIDSDTTYRLPGQDDAALGDLEPGMQIAVRGTLDEDGSLLAGIVGARPEMIHQGRLQGEVTAIDDNQITVTTARGDDVVISTDDETQIYMLGVEQPSLDDLAVGDRIVGQGHLSQDEAVAALIVVLPDDVARVAGEVLTVEEGALLVDTAGGEITLLVGDDALVHLPGEASSLSDLSVGDQVHAMGVWQDEETFQVLGLGGGVRFAGRSGRVQGRMIQPEDDGFTLGSPQGPVDVIVDEQTRFHMPGVDDPGLDDLHPGHRVGAQGVWSDEGSFHAQGVQAGE